MGKGCGNVGTIDCSPNTANAILFTARALLKRFILFRWAVAVAIAVAVALLAVGIVAVFSIFFSVKPILSRGIAEGSQAAAYI